MPRIGWWRWDVPRLSSCGAFPRNLRGMTKENRDETMHRFLPGPGGRPLSPPAGAETQRGDFSARRPASVRTLCCCPWTGGTCPPSDTSTGWPTPATTSPTTTTAGRDPVGGHCLRPEPGGLRQGPGAAERRPVRHSGDLGGGLRLHPHRRGPDCHGPGSGRPGRPSTAGRRPIWPCWPAWGWTGRKRRPSPGTTISTSTCTTSTARRAASWPRGA